MAETAAAPSNTPVKFSGKKNAAAKKAKPKAALATDAAAPASKNGDDRDWEAEDGLRTLQRAQQHQDDPDMMGRISKVANRQMDQLGKLQKQGIISDTQAAKIADRRKATRE